MNLCKDCKHAVNDYPPSLKEGELGQKMMIDHYNCSFAFEDVIAGSREMNPERYQRPSCHNMRYSGPCGYEGAFWESRA